MTDRDMLLAIAMALGGLSERLTGCSLQVRIPKDNGDYQKFILSGSSVEWLATNACLEPPDLHAYSGVQRSKPDEVDCAPRNTH